MWVCVLSSPLLSSRRELHKPYCSLDTPPSTPYPSSHPSQGTHDSTELSISPGPQNPAYLKVLIATVSPVATTLPVVTSPLAPSPSFFPTSSSAPASACPVLLLPAGCAVLSVLDSRMSWAPYLMRPGLQCGPE